MTLEPPSGEFSSIEDAMAAVVAYIQSQHPESGIYACWTCNRAWAHDVGHALGGEIGQPVQIESMCATCGQWTQPAVPLTEEMTPFGRIAYWGDASTRDRLIAAHTRLLSELNQLDDHAATDEIIAVLDQAPALRPVVEWLKAVDAGTRGNLLVIVLALVAWLAPSPLDDEPAPPPPSIDQADVDKLIAELGRIRDELGSPHGKHPKDDRPSTKPHRRD